MARLSSTRFTVRTIVLASALGMVMLLLGLLRVEDCAGTLPSDAVVGDRLGQLPLACGRSPVGFVSLRHAAFEAQALFLWMKEFIR